MILTITLNPSMDYIYQIEHFSLGKQNRFAEPTRMPGGKGINASRAISLLGEEVLAFTLVGGKNGERIEQELNEDKFKTVFLKVKEESRNAITIMHDRGIQTEIVEEGPEITEEKGKEVFAAILSILENDKIDIVTINGSINTTDPYFYSKLLETLRTKVRRELKILMDISKSQLKNVVNESAYYPDFIKPNIIEFGELIGLEMSSKQDVLEYLAENYINVPYLLVSCGEMGAVAQFGDTVYDVSIPEIELVNPTGSGDSTVGGVATALERKLDHEGIIRMAMACGVANALESGVGVVSPENVERIYEQVGVKIFAERTKRQE